MLKNKWRRIPVRSINSAPFPTTLQSTINHPWRLCTVEGRTSYNVALPFLIFWWWEIVVDILSEEEGGDGSYTRRRYDVDGDDDDGQRNFLCICDFVWETAFYSPRDVF